LVQVYNFLASWQLFPEKGIYKEDKRPKSGIYKIESREQKELTISKSWVTLENESFVSEFTIRADGERHPILKTEIADEARVLFINSTEFEIDFYSNNETVFHIKHQILPNGYLKIVEEDTNDKGEHLICTEIYHKQMSVLPYAASVAGALIKPTEEGIIRHKALTAMEEQTNMQLDQIRKQIELLALQAQEIQQRKELSMKIYNAKLAFKPEIGHVYYLYQKDENQHTLSLISPKEWGPSMPYHAFVAAVQMLADHTWKEL